MKKLMVLPVTGIIALMASCQGYGGRMMDGPGHMNGYGFMRNYSYGGIFMIITIILVIALIGFGVYYYMNKRTINSEGNALDILKKRYAQGEITKEEFEEMKKSL